MVQAAINRRLMPAARVHVMRRVMVMESDLPEKSSVHIRF